MAQLSIENSELFFGGMIYLPNDLPVGQERNRGSDTGSSPRHRAP